METRTTFPRCGPPAPLREGRCPSPRPNVKSPAPPRMWRASPCRLERATSRSPGVNGPFISDYETPKFRGRPVSEFRSLSPNCVSPNCGGVLEGDSYVGIGRISLSVALKHDDPDEVFGRVGPTLSAECSAVAERIG